MRPVLALAVMLLALTVALENARWLQPPPPPGPRLADRALELLVGAKGPLLPAARVGTGPERIGTAMRIGDCTLVAPAPDGLRAAFVGPDLAFRGQAHYDVAGSAEDCAALAREVRAARAGDVLVLASGGRLAPPGGTPHAGFTDALAQLGARARPGTTTPESWALIALRGARGWVPLAEGYGTDTGVALGYVLGPDLAQLETRAPDLVHARAGRQVEVELCDELVHAARRTPGAVLAREARVRGQPAASLLVPPERRDDGTQAPGRIEWHDVAVGPGSGVFALLGLDDRSAPGSDGVVFQVWFDGEEAPGARVVAPGGRWRPGLFDLRPFAGRRGTLALVVEPRGDATGDRALWGRPQLFHGYERSPLEVWGQEGGPLHPPR
ncbi:MAG TPA: hypothetical protein VF530_04575 [Planctomycetota bacterium]